VKFSTRVVGRRRFVLWALLLALVLALLVTLVWLAGRYETSQIEARLERDATESVLDIRNGLTRNVQSFQALQSSSPTTDAWLFPATDLLRERREVMRLEWLEPQHHPGRRQRGLHCGAQAERRGVFKQLFFATTGRPGH
jgi:two-component system, LuxR family, sensor histidine kinase DctS